jgi:alpha-glucuronidase
MAGRIAITIENINRIVVVRGGMSFRIIVEIFAGKAAKTSDAFRIFARKIFMPAKVASRIVISEISKKFKDAGKTELWVWLQHPPFLMLN